MLAADVPCRREFALSWRDWTSEVANVVAMQSDNSGWIWHDALVWKCIDLQNDETCWLSVTLASRVTPKVLMLSEKGIWEPAIVGVETKGKLWRRCRVPNKMDSDLQGRYDRISYVEQTNKRRDELSVRLHRQLLKRCKFECRLHTNECWHRTMKQVSW